MTSTYDVARVREDFPILQRRLAGDLPLVYLDSANTSQKPRQVVDAIDAHYLAHNANVARAMHQLGAEASEAFELGRTKVADFIGANRREEVVFTKNASEALNLVARVLGDVAARQVANIARGFLDWGRKASGSLATNVVEFLQEEGRDVPTRVEVEEFLEGVDRLRDDAERLEARLARLEATRRATVK